MQDVPTGTLPTDTEYWMLSGAAGADGDVTTAAMNSAIDYAVGVLDTDLQGQIDAIETSIIPIERGGTGQSTVATSRNALGLGNTSGAVPIANGGTGQTTVAAARNAFGLGNTSGAVPIANGGTGQTTAAGVRNTLGLGNTTGAVPVANGGTGQTTAAATRNALGLGNTTGAVPIANGGSNATNESDALTNFGIRRGSFWTNGVDGDSYGDFDVTFDTPLPSTPNVVASLLCTTGANYVYGKLGVAVISTSKSTTGFTLRVFNDNANPLSPGVEWIATV